MGTEKRRRGPTWPALVGGLDCKEPLGQDASLVSAMAIELDSLRSAVRTLAQQLEHMRVGCETMQQAHNALAQVFLDRSQRGPAYVDRTVLFVAEHGRIHEYASSDPSSPASPSDDKAGPS